MRRTFIHALCVGFMFLGFGGSAQAEGGPHLSYDLGVSSGQLNNISYLEGQLGLNWHIHEWLIWRNAAFYRSRSSAEDYYGLDSALRLQAEIGGGPVGLRVFGGPGVRFPSQGEISPTAEGGLVVNLAGLSIGGGVRVILNEWVDDRVPNDTMFFIILSGGGVL